MNVTVTLEHHFYRTQDGRVWTETAFALPFWERYLQVFDAVRVIARVRTVKAPEPCWREASGVDVSFVDIPDYQGPYQYLACWPEVRRILRQQARQSEAVILRLGSSIGSAFVDHCQRDRPFGVEVVGDPNDVFRPGSVVHSLRPVFRVWFAADLKRLCNRACAAAYVTDHTLQERYPCPSYSTSLSDVEIGPDAIVLAPRPWRLISQPARLISIGSLAQKYKGVDILLQSMQICARQNLSLSLTIVGDGRHRPELQALAADLGLQDSVHFSGQMPAGPSVRNALDAADLFVMPSRVEGLPRAMVEAMARALPCIGTSVGGIPELLPAENLVPVGDSLALAAAIEDVLRNPERMSRMSRENLSRAHEFSEDRLRHRRHGFLTAVKDATTEWMRGTRGTAAA